MPDSALEPVPVPEPVPRPERALDSYSPPRPRSGSTVDPPEAADPAEAEVRATAPETADRADTPAAPDTEDRAEAPAAPGEPTGGALGIATGTVPGRQLNATAASLLGFLHEGPMTGWDLLVTAQRRIGGFWSLTQSQVYRELAAMARAGLIEAGERGRRDRQPYTITQAGRAAFSAWASREPGHETIRFPLLLSIMFGRHVPAERLAWYITDHRRVHAARLAAYERQRAELPAGAAETEPYAAATLDFGLAYERAVLAWLDALPQAVSGHCARGT